jgi:hypothetical protein
MQQAADTYMGDKVGGKQSEYFQNSLDFGGGMV